MNQKDNLEYYAVKNFITEYNRTHKKRLFFISQCKPPKPDTICRHHKREIGVEIAHTYGTGEEAAVRLGNRDSNDFSDEVHRKRSIIPFNYRALDSLNKILSKKATRTYELSHIWLVIRNAFSLWSLSDYRKYKKDIFIPEKHPFRQIWILCDENSAQPNGIMRII
ncbi:hypothetical protein ACFL6W_10625 [Thermodesulfobacteriota bacterium]